MLVLGIVLYTAKVLNDTLVIYCHSTVTNQDNIAL
jgi:hypothetical protein